MIIIKLIKSVLNLIYRLMCLGDTKKKVLFMSRQSNEPSLDVRRISDEIERSHPDYRTVMMCRKVGAGLAGKASYALYVLRQMSQMAGSRMVVLDSYCVPASILKHRSHQTIAQIWHSIGTMKKNSYSILDEPEGRSSKIAYALDMHKNYDIIICAGEGYRNYLAESFNYPPEALTILPLPRTDVLRDEEARALRRAGIFKAHPELAKGVNIIYAPTFRKGMDEQEPFRKAVTALKAAAAEYGDKYNLIVKAHPLSEVESDYPEYSTMDMLPAADFFISDYSCVIYEAGVMKIPFFFYAYDYEEYMSRRSVYIDYANEIPGGMYKKASDLLEAIDSGRYDTKEMEAFIDKYVDLPDGSAAEKFVELLFSKSEGTSGH